MKFEWRDSWEISLREISALCARHDPSRGAEELLAVGDERWAVIAVALTALDAASPPATELAAGIAAAGMAPEAGSEFEGVASDSCGRVFMLQEGPARVLVFDAAMAELQHTITLNVPAEQPDVGAMWASEPNARGEGLLLLGDGHMLIAKQRKPVRLLEFGPAGDAPLGHAAGRPLGDEAVQFAAGDVSALDVLASWSLDPAVMVESINDLAVDGEQRLHFISSRSRCIGRLEADLDPAGGSVAASVLALPDQLFTSEEDRAEGLVFTTELGWLVALDLQRQAPNLHQLALVPD